jgi:DNA adenine methylase
MSDALLKAPFPYFGGKSKVATVVWRAFGPDVRNYVEPFFGSGAVLLGRPQPFTGVETVNDKDGMIANFWRALQHDPEQTAHWLDWPVNENDLTARHIWLVNHKESLQTRLEGDPDFYDAKIAGWWCWGLCAWIGSGWCSGVGPWQSIDGELVNVKEGGVWKQRVHLGAGRGVNRQRVHLTHCGTGVHSAPYAETCAERTAWLLDYMQRLADRLRHVRVCCGDWSRVCGSATTLKTFSPTAVFLDPPYAHSERDTTLYTVEMETATAVRAWAIAHGDDPAVRIALCGYDGEHAMPSGWTEYAWKAPGGYGGQNKAEKAGRGEANRHRERIWFSPYCLPLEAETPMEALFALNMAEIEAAP